MDISAGVIDQQGQSPIIRTLQLDRARPDEAVVEIHSVGICHTDIATRDGYMPGVVFPAVLGHEGAGKVVGVGEDVTDVAVGDHVVLSFASCGDCGPCDRGVPSECRNFMAENVGGHRRDGSHTHRESGRPVNGCFFGQSSFASHALVRQRNLVKVPDHLPLELLGPLGCGLQTGAGTVLNFLKPAPGSSIAIFGAGAVGLAAAMAARIAGCAPIILLDIVPERLRLALELGATHEIDARAGDAAQAIRAIVPDGAEFIIEASGAPSAMVAAIAALAQRGTLCPIAMTAPGATITVPLASLRAGRIQSVTEGGAVPRDFIPRLIDLHGRGLFPFDRLIDYYDFSDISQAMADADRGRSIKPVLLVSAEARARLGR